MASQRAAQRQATDGQSDCLPFQVPFNCVWGKKSTHFIGPGEKEENSSAQCEHLRRGTFVFSLASSGLWRIASYKSLSSNKKLQERKSKSISIVSRGGWESSASVWTETHLFL